VLEVEVGVGVTITNHNGGSLALTNVTVHDCIGGTFTPPTLDTNGCPTPTAITNSVNSCATNGGTLSSTVAPLSSTTIAGGTTGNTEAWSDTYFPSVPPACGTNNSFSDQALVTGDCSSSFCTCAHAAGISATAICPLCPNACPSTPGL